MTLTPPLLVLASASPRRRDLLVQLGRPADVIDPADIDETPYAGELPRLYALRIAEEKSRVTAARHPQSLILAGDTVVAIGRRILPKTETEAEARACLEALSGRRHRVISAIALKAPDGETRLKAVISHVAFKRLSKGDIAWYLASGEWQGKAGGYAIQGRAARFVRFLSGSYSNIMGLPLFEVAGWLEAFQAPFKA